MSTTSHMIVGQIPFFILLAMPAKLYLEDSHACANYDLAEYITWGYEGVLSVICAMMVVNLRSGNTYYEYPNYSDSCLECIGMLMQTFLHGFVLLSPALSYDAKRLLLAFGNTVVIPVTVFLGVMAKPLWKFYRNDAEFTRDFDQRFGSRVTAASLAGAYCGVGYRAHSRGSRSREDYYFDQKPEGTTPSFEVEELARLVMAGELRLVKQCLYNTTLSLVREKDSEGSTPVHRAVRNMHKEMIEFLLDMGADPNAVENDGVTPLHIAASLGNVECIYLLAGVNKADVNIMTETHGKTPLDIAVKSECMATIVTLLNLGADPNRCVACNDSEPLMDVRSYVRKVGHYSKYKSPFFLAVELGLDRIINFMHSIHLSKGGVAVNSPGPQGMLPLGVAALLGHCRVVESMLTLKADIMQVNPRQGRSAFHYVCMKGSLKTFQVLLKGLSRRILLDDRPAPILESQCQWSAEPDPLGPNVASLDESVGHPDLHNNSGSSSSSEGGGLPNKFFDFLNAQDVYGRTMLHYAVLKGSAQITYMLLCLGASTTIEDHPPAQGSSAAPTGPLSPIPDCPTMGWTALRYAQEFARQHDPFQKVVAVFPEAARLLERKAHYPYHYLHDDAKWLPVAAV